VKTKRARSLAGFLLAQGKGHNWDRFQLHTNYVVQGSAADVLKAAMAKTFACHPSEVRMIATVHDELIFDCPSAYAVHYSEMIRLIMEDCFTVIFGPELPIAFEAKVCRNWGEK
jgi:DNA polymerase-1